MKSLFIVAILYISEGTILKEFSNLQTLTDGFKANITPSMASCIIQAANETVGRISKSISQADFNHFKSLKQHENFRTNENSFIEKIRTQTARLITLSEDLENTDTKEILQVVGYTKFPSSKPGTSADVDDIHLLGCSLGPSLDRRRPAQICKPLRTLCKPRSRSAMACSKCDLLALSDDCQEGMESALCLSPSIANICRSYRAKRRVGARTQGESSQQPGQSRSYGNFGRQQQNQSGQDNMQPCPVDSFGAFCEPLVPPGPPFISDIDCSGCPPDDYCQPQPCPPPQPQQPCQPPPKNPKTGHCPCPPGLNRDKIPFKPIPYPSDDPCLMLPPIPRPPTYKCPCNCFCDVDSDSDIGDDCQNSIEEDCPLSKFFEEKFKTLSNRLENLPGKGPNKQDDLDKVIKEKETLQTELDSLTAKCMQECKLVKKVECELANIKSRVCAPNVKPTNERDESFCCRVALEHMIFLYGKIDRLRQGVTLKEQLVKMCDESKTRLADYIKELKEDVKKVQNIAKEIKKSIDEIKKTICFSGRA